MGIPCAAGKVSVQLHGSGSVPYGSPSYKWTTNCPDGSFDDDTSANPTLSFTAASSGGQPASCSVQLSINGEGGGTNCSAPVGVDICITDCKGKVDGTSTLDRCGVCDGDGQSCVKCETVDISSAQIALDSSALSKRNIIFSASRTLVQAFKSDKKVTGLAKKYNQQAADLYQQSWTTTYSIQNVVLTCTESSPCVNVSTAAAMESYKANNDQFKALLRTIQKQLKKGPKKSLNTVQKLQSKLDKLAQGDLDYIAAIPSTVSSCPK